MFLRFIDSYIGGFYRFVYRNHIDKCKIEVAKDVYDMVSYLTWLYFMLTTALFVYIFANVYGPIKNIFPVIIISWLIALGISRLIVKYLKQMEYGEKLFEEIMQSDQETLRRKTKHYFWKAIVPTVASPFILGFLTIIFDYCFDNYFNA